MHKAFSDRRVGWAWRDAVDNVVDDLDVHADIPEGYCRDQIVDRVVNGSGFETVVNARPWEE